MGLSFQAFYALSMTFAVCHSWKSWTTGEIVLKKTEERDTDAKVKNLLQMAGMDSRTAMKAKCGYKEARKMVPECGCAKQFVFGSTKSS